MRDRNRRRLSLALAAVAATGLVACTPSTPDPTPEPTSPTDEGSETATGSGEAGPDPSASPSPSPSEPADYPNPWGPTPEEVDPATEEAAAMSADEVAGQVIVSTIVDPRPDVVAAHVEDFHLGGVILMGEAVTSLEQVAALTDAVQQAHSGSGRDWPALVSTDNEGGTVQRLDSTAGPWTDFPEFAVAGQAAANDDDGAVTDAYTAMGRELRGAGINTDWAPVADVTVPGQDAIIGGRSASSDPAIAARTVGAATRGFLDAAVLPAAKHFPGHGSLTADSHETLPSLTRGDDELAAQDLPPFESAIEAGTPMIMVGHIDVTTWDPGVAASVSPEAYRVLRDELGFSGVAVTDGLDMGALTPVGDPGDIAVAALDAGADLLLGPASDAQAHDGIVAALRDGTLDRDRVNEAAGRVIAMMEHQAELAARLGPVGPDAAGSASEAVAALEAAAAG